MVDELIYGKREGVLCKLDMEKAYDNVNWRFVDYMFWRLSFGEKWKRWMKTCINTTSSAIVVNGGPSSFFKTPRGLRQDNSSSPLLFVVVMEDLNGMLTRAKES